MLPLISRHLLNASSDLCQNGIDHVVGGGLGQDQGAAVRGGDDALGTGGLQRGLEILYPLADGIAPGAVDQVDSRIDREVKALKWARVASRVSTDLGRVRQHAKRSCRNRIRSQMEHDRKGLTPLPFRRPADIPQ